MLIDGERDEQGARVCVRVCVVCVCVCVKKKSAAEPPPTADARTALSRIAAARGRLYLSRARAGQNCCWRRVGEEVEGKCSPRKKISSTAPGALNVPGLTGQVANAVRIARHGERRVSRQRCAGNPNRRPRLDDNWLNGEISTTGKIGGTSDAEPEEEARRQGHGA